MIFTQPQMNNQNLPVILIYYKFRGLLQPIRNILCYLQIPFIEIHPQFIEQEKKVLEPAIKQRLKQLKIDKNKLPLMVHETFVIYDQYPILKYICRRFNREDLLGTNAFETARLYEILQKYYLKQPHSMVELLRLGQMASHKSLAEMQRQRVISFNFLMNTSGYLREICENLDNQEEPKYILKNRMTIMDFLFFQSCNYMLGLYSEIDKYKIQFQDLNCKMEESNKMQKINEIGENHFTIGKKPNFYYLNIMRNYLAGMRNHQFYVKNKHFLDSFTVTSILTSEQKTLGLKKIWTDGPIK